MKKFLLVVEPLRLRAVQRWFEQQGVVLICSREFVAPSGSPAKKGRPTNPPRSEGRAVDYLRAIHRPALFRGRAMSAELLARRYPTIAEVSPGDLLIVPHLPHRGALSVYRVAAPGAVAGSSATSALPLGFKVSHSFIVGEPWVADSAQRIALAQALPMPAGPVTKLQSVGPLWDNFLAGLPA